MRAALMMSPGCSSMKKLEQFNIQSRYHNQL